MEVLLSLFRSMEPLKIDRNPQSAAFLGFLFGGVGLGIYFRAVESSRQRAEGAAKGFGV